MKFSSKYSFLLPYIIIFSSSILMFSDILFSNENIILSNYGQDTSHLFLPLRAFGFEQLSSGNLPLWCPDIYSGIPYMGDIQSALLYPLNIIYLILPLPIAINYSFLLHILLSGIFMYLWTSHRKLHMSASILSSILLMFCGASFLHIYAGHIPHHSSLIWIPLILLSIDGIIDNQSPSWCLVGIFAVSMQILAGIGKNTKK